MQLNPWLKLGLWALTVTIIAGVVELAAWLVGADFSLLSVSGGGRGVLMVVAVGSLLVLMAADRRPAADYGLVIPQNWPRQFLTAVAVGMGCYAGFCGLTVLAGAQAVQTEQATLYRVVTGFLSGMTSMPVATSQQIIFSGYLLSLFRNHYGRAWGVAIAAALFAVCFLVNQPIAISADDLRLMVGMFAVQALLCLMRLSHGTILVPSGALAGCLIVRRVLRRTGLLVVTDPLGTSWWAPAGDPRQSPILWGLVAVAIGVYVWRLRVRGEAQPGTQNAIDASFKRVAPFSNVCMLAPLDLWIGRLRAANWDVGAAYVPRLLGVFAFSTLNTVLSLPERLLLPLILRKRKVQAPVFILGVHRSGTTHLHNLMALDPNLVTPRAYQIMNPIGFLFSGWLLAPLLGAFSPWKRPMDSVRFHLFAPNEDEFALTGVTHLSPYWGPTFPRQWALYDRFIFPGQMTTEERTSWKRHYLLFLRKLVFWRGKRPLLKNPYNTGRVEALVEMFPEAKFVHIYRHPNAVYRSNQHMAREGHCVYQLHDPDELNSYGARFLDNYRAMEDAFYAESAELPARQVVDLKYEELDQNPIEQLKRIYAQLELPWDAKFEERLTSYLASVADYEKNKFRPMPEEQQRLIYAKMSPYFSRWGYAMPEAPAKAA
jgi:hypothetical protein